MNTVTRRAKLWLPGREVTYPTHMTQKCTLLQKINEGDILVGELIAPVTFKKFWGQQRHNSNYRDKLSYMGMGMGMGMGARSP